MNLQSLIPSRIEQDTAPALGWNQAVAGMKALVEFAESSGYVLVLKSEMTQQREGP